LPEACRFGGDQELQGTVPGMIVPGSWLIKVVKDPFEITVNLMPYPDFRSVNLSVLYVKL
jgi:hypothetical protein